jgi:isopentenyl diphosphate isomerase/L-lactate dehydrogenase-like FMN-dependent dehydrogenase
VPDLTAPNMTGRGEPAATLFGAYRQWAASPLLAWEDVRWLAEQWGGPFMVKGVTRIDDAKRAADAGAAAISASNHGGNDLDGTPATIRVLPAIAAAANGQAGVENVLDVLRGSIDSALLGLGHSTNHDLTPDDLVIPPGFTRTLSPVPPPALCQRPPEPREIGSSSTAHTSPPTSPRAAAGPPIWRSPPSDST